MSIFQTKIISKRREDWIVRPYYETVIHSNGLGEMVQLRTLTDQNYGHPHRLEVKARNWPTRNQEWDEIEPRETFKYKTRDQAIGDHENTVTLFFRLFERGTDSDTFYNLLNKISNN
jgi:hypothetical protein